MKLTVIRGAISGRGLNSSTVCCSRENLFVVASRLIKLEGLNSAT